MKLIDLIDAVAKLPERLAETEGTIVRVLTAVTDVRTIAQNITYMLRRADRTFVYVLPTGGIPMLAQNAIVEPGNRLTMTFESTAELPAGTWIVAVGPARVSGVRVGNQSQEAFADYNGHVCQTRDPLPLGVRLAVNLQNA